MIRLFAAVNGEVLSGLGGSTTPTYTRIHFLLSELGRHPDVEIRSIRFGQRPRTGLFSLLYNAAARTVAAARSARLIVKDRPLVFFAYPHSMTAVQYRMLFLLCTALQIPTAVDIHDTIEQAHAVGSGTFAVSRRFEAFCMKHATVLIATSQPMWEHTRNKYGISGRQAIIAPNAFDEAFTQRYPGRYTGSNGRFNVCYIGGISRNRGVDLLVDACSVLHERHPCLRLTLLGPYGPGVPPETRERIERSDFIARKEIPREAVPSSLADVDLFVMPYNPHEPYLNYLSPIKIYEYIGTAKPILCTKCASLLDIAEEGGIAYVDYDAGEMMEAIERFIVDPGLRKSASEHLLKSRMQHTWSERAERVYQGIRSSLPGTG
ncbi:MAG: glycosyltransferase family 4 protein [Methanomicrobiaceae archaeon]|nr:glycosyltransferase family 4 protein [Methanomicrobiaceae archaeon]MDD5420445.1 glycosyltransferase family 4 protein [Methanomicrobiaceae archaeon]